MVKLFHGPPAPVVLSCHWYIRPPPVAVTLNVAAFPAHTLVFDGLELMAGAAFTVNKAALELMGEHALLTTHRYK